MAMNTYFINCLKSLLKHKWSRKTHWFHLSENFTVNIFTPLWCNHFPFSFRTYRQNRFRLAEIHLLKVKKKKVYDGDWEFFSILKPGINSIHSQLNPHSRTLSLFSYLECWNILNMSKSFITLRNIIIWEKISVYKAFYASKITKRLVFNLEKKKSINIFYE